MGSLMRRACGGAASSSAAPSTSLLRLLRLAIVGERKIRSIFARLLDQFLGRDWLDRLGLDFLAEHVSHRTDRVDAGKKIGNVQEAGLLQADIDERGLHSREHPRHLPLVDISYNAALLVALEIEFGQRVVLDCRHPHLKVAGVN